MADPQGEQSQDAAAPGRVGVWQALALIVVLPAALIAAAELLIRVTGFEQLVVRQVSKRMYPVAPGEEEAIFSTRIFDPVTQWRLRPNAWLPGKIGRINSHGFVGREFRWTKRPGTKRILMLGDSVTYGIWACGNMRMCRDRPYATGVELLLWDHTHGDRYEVLNGAVYGYSSHQGLRYLRTYLKSLQPDVVTIMFGWNDHGVLLGVESRDLENPVLRAVQNGAQHLATYRTMVGIAAWVALRLKPVGALYLPPTYLPRVPLPEFQQNLRALVDEVRRLGATPILLTEPWGPNSEPYRTGEIPAPWAVFMLKDYDALMSIHRTYNDAMRAVAKEIDVPLVDADAEFERRDKTALFNPYDLIHPNEAGYAIIAQQLFDRLVAERLVDPPPLATAAAR